MRGTNTAGPEAGSARENSTAIDFLAVTDFHDDDEKDFIVDFVQDPEVAMPNTVLLFVG